MHFVWDPKKAAENFKKHKVSFDEAKLVFLDPFAISEQDKNYPERRVVIGASGENRVLFVVHVDFSDEEHDVYRIVSARKASKTQIRRYVNGDDD